MPTNTSGTFSELAYLPTRSRGSPSVDAPSVTTITAASDVPRKSFSTCRIGAVERDPCHLGNARGIRPRDQSLAAGYSYAVLGSGWPASGLPLQASPEGKPTDDSR